MYMYMFLARRTFFIVRYNIYTHDSTFVEHLYMVYVRCICTCTCAMYMYSVHTCNILISTCTVHLMCARQFTLYMCICDGSYMYSTCTVHVHEHVV